MVVPWFLGTFNERKREEDTRFWLLFDYQFLGNITVPYEVRYLHFEC
jgi:hypothetical protein